MNRFAGSLFGGSLIVAAGLYLWMGQSLMPDQPISGRIAELSDKDPLDLTGPEMMARLQSVARRQPDRPEPHYHMAILLRSQGRLDEAVAAFMSALRRDGAYVPALVELGDTLVSAGRGEVSPAAADYPQPGNNRVFCVWRP